MKTAAVRPAAAGDIAALAGIYNHYVKNTAATLQEEEATDGDFSRLLSHADEKSPFLCAEIGGEIAGYCYAAAFKARCGYRRTYESSVYVSPAHLRQGVGAALMRELIRRMAATDIKNLIAVIGLPNAGSVVLHENFGFVHCGTLPGAGYKFGEWRDVGYWMKKLAAD